LFEENLSSRLGRLEDTGVVTASKEFVGRMPRTNAALITTLEPPR
jgi:hypothetical protein